MNIYEKLTKIQQELKAPKNQFNKFGNYNYRGCEDILEAVKPLLDKHNVALIISDNIKIIGERYYVEAICTLYNTDEPKTSCDIEKIEVRAYAREEDNKKGFDSSQLTGSTSSYARKYALNGLFAIDDSKDSDALPPEPKKPEPKKPETKKPETKKETPANKINDAQVKRMFAISKGNADLCKDAISQYGYKSSKDVLVKDYETICKLIEQTVKNMEKA